MVISFSSSHSEAKTKANRTLHPRQEPFGVHGTEFYLTLLRELDLHKREENTDESLTLEREEKEWGAKEVLSACTVRELRRSRFGAGYCVMRTAQSL